MSLPTAPASTAPHSAWVNASSNFARGCLAPTYSFSGVDLQFYSLVRKRKGPTFSGVTWAFSPDLPFNDTALDVIFGSFRLTIFGTSGLAMYRLEKCFSLHECTIALYSGVFHGAFGHHRVNVLIMWGCGVLLREIVIIFGQIWRVGVGHGTSDPQFFIRFLRGAIVLATQRRTNKCFFRGTFGSGAIVVFNVTCGQGVGLGRVGSATIGGSWGVFGLVVNEGVLAITTWDFGAQWGVAYLTMGQGRTNCGLDHFTYGLIVGAGLFGLILIFFFCASSGFNLGIITCVDLVWGHYGRARVQGTWGVVITCYFGTFAYGNWGLTCTMVIGITCAFGPRLRCFLGTFAIF